MSWLDEQIKKIAGSVDFDLLKVQGLEYMQKTMLRLSCIWDESARTRRTLEAVYGKAPEPQKIAHGDGSYSIDDDPKYAPRSLSSAARFYRPWVDEDDDRTGTTEKKTLDVEADLGRCASSGYIANIGTDEFDVIVTSGDATRSAFTVPAGVSEAFSFFVSSIEIMPVGTGKARYQVRCD